MDYSYSELGATNSELLPPQFRVDRNQVELGSGLSTWTRAVEAMKRWEMFNFPWVRLCWPATPIVAGSNVAVLVSLAGWYSLNACRIVYTFDEDAEVRRFGFAYGTLTEHAESGEERFLITWDRKTGSVCYELLAFSRPNQFLSRLGYPLARQVQKRFAQHSKAAMLRAAQIAR